MTDVVEITFTGTGTGRRRPRRSYRTTRERAAAAPGALPAAGWYVDPKDALQRRWWNGVEWTEHTRPVAAVPVRFATAPGEGVRDTRSSIQDLVSALATSSSAPAPPSGIVPGPRRGDAGRPAVSWVDLPERNPAATSALVVALVSVVLNPALVLSVVALIVGGVGLARSARSYLGAGRRCAIVAMVVAGASAILWSAMTVWLLLDPQLLAAVGIRL